MEQSFLEMAKQDQNNIINGYTNVEGVPFIDCWKKEN